MRVRFATQSYKSKSRKVSSQRCVNMYAAAQPSDAKSEVAVFGAPGIGAFASCGVGPIRGFKLMGGILYAVSGGSLYRVNRDGSAAAVGAGLSGTDPVSIDDNGTQLCIVNGTNGYIYSVGGGFQLITDADFHSANSVTYIDGVFAFDQAGTNEFFISASLDGTSFTDLFASAERKSDNVVAVLNHLESLYVFGEATTEPWYNAGAAGFPFQRIEGAAIDKGVIGARAFSSYDQKLHLVGNDRVAYRIVGNQLTAVSTDAINEEWQNYQTISDAKVFSYTFEGRKLTVFNFPSIAATWVFDANSGLWHERVSWDVNNRSLGRWRANCAIEAYGKTLIGDAFSGRVGYLDSNIFTEFGSTIQAELISPPIHGDGKTCFMPWFELDIESGKGLASGQGDDPQIMLEISDDGGNTWSDQQPWESMGKIGEYRQRLRWSRLGSFTERLLKLTISDPVMRTVIAARCPEMTIGL